MEQWIKIPNYSRYEASTLGNIRSLNYKNSGKAVILKPSVSNDGYLKTMLLRDDGKYTSRTVHSFICMAYLGEKPKDYQINHKSGNKLDNSIWNLEYCTASENVLHAFRHNLRERKVGSKNGMAKLTEEQVREIRQHAKDNGRYYGRKELAIKYKVSECTIKEIVTRRKNKFYNA